ncbi:MAG: hypothetical protein ACRCYV_06900 [Aeromonas sp.]
MSKLNPSEATGLAFNTLSSQIQNILCMPDAPAKAAIGGFAGLLEANMQMISEAANDQVDEFNALIDELEARDAALNSTQQQLTAARADQQRAQEALSQAQAQAAAQAEADCGLLQAEIERLESELLDANRDSAALGVKTSAANLAMRELDQKLKALMALNPESLKRRVKEKNDLLEAQRQVITKHKGQEARYRQELLEKERRMRDLLAAMELQAAELDRRNGIIAEQERAHAAKALWYQHLSNTYRDQDGALWNAYVCDHGIQATAPDIINDLDWKLHAMKSDGTGYTIMISQWLKPVYPAIVDVLPDDLTDDLITFIHAALEVTHPYLSPRCDWAKGVSIYEIDGLPPRVLRSLEHAGLHSLFDIVSNQGGARLASLKGVGEKTLAQMLYACQLQVTRWDAEQAELAAGTATKAAA